MKTLESYDVQELNIYELNETNGGALSDFFTTAQITAAIDLNNVEELLNSVMATIGVTQYAQLLNIYNQITVTIGS